MNVPNDIILKIKSKIIDKSDYHYDTLTNSSLKLSDKILIYNSGDAWKIIPLNVLLSYPIIYDEFVQENEKYDISIILCPVTLRCTIFKGIFECESYDNIRMILREKNTESIIPIDFGIKIDKKYLIQSNKRLETMIMTLKSGLMIAPDAQTMIYKKTLSFILPKTYYENTKDINNNELDGLIHPKTLVYIIQYKSYTSDDDKYSIILGKDAAKDAVTGYDSKKSGITEYLSIHRQKIINKNYDLF